jgi:hypothetical protein
MRSKLYGGIAILLAVLFTAGVSRGQSGLGTPTSFGGVSGGASGEGLLDAGGLPGLDSGRNIFTAPLGDPGKTGFFTFFDAVYLNDSWTLGRNQIVAWRGLVDTTGQVTSLPGTYLGSGVPALTTGQLGRRSTAPGFNIGAGYKFDDGSSVHARILHTAGQTYNAGASLASQYARSRPDLADTFLTSGVFNFPPNFAGPRRKTAFEGSQVYPGYFFINPTTGNSIDISGIGFLLPNGNVVVSGSVGVDPIIVPARFLGDGLFYGIWNGASNMTISYKKWYTEAEIGGRVPLFESNTSKIYGLGGARFHHFMERFKWLTQSYDLDGNSGPRDAAEYTNTLSQRMYGPYVGCGHEMYLGKRFSLSAELHGGAMLNVIKERAKYELLDNTIQNKRSLTELQFSPTAGANMNLWWYPVKGVQMRVGYQANTFYNTKRMSEAIGFNYGAIDPGYSTQYFRMIHGVNVGLGIFF